MDLWKSVKLGQPFPLHYKQIETDNYIKPTLYRVKFAAPNSKIIRKATERMDILTKVWGSAHFSPCAE